MSQQEKEMLASFNSQVLDLLASRERFVRNSHSLKVGLESEIAVHAQLDDAELVQRRDAIISDNSDFTDIELGAMLIKRTWGYYALARIRFSPQLVLLEPII